MYNTDVRLLKTEQAQAFDEEYVCDTLFQQIKPYYNIYSKQNRFDVLDVGGGNGVYADRLLRTFQRSHVTVLEPDAYLLSRNRSHQRKQIVQGTFQSAELSNYSFDIIQFNWVLHHFVSNSYSKTRALQQEALREARMLLRPGGRIIILENFYDGFLFDNLPSRIIYSLTSNKWISPLIKHAGANTAGVGVCFNSKKCWEKQIKAAEFNHIQIEHCYDFSALGWLKRNLLGINKQHVGLIAAR